MRKFNIAKHGDKANRAGRWITAENLRAAKVRAERFAGLLNQERFDWAWETCDAGHVYQLHVIRSHQIVRSYTLRPDWR
jgi:hypothetical protein